MDTVFRSVFRAFGIAFVFALTGLDPDKAQLADILHLLHSGSFWMFFEVLALLFFALDASTSEFFGAGLDEIHKWFARKVRAIRG